MKTAIINAKLVFPYRVEEGGLLLEDGKIVAVLGSETPETDQIIDAKGLKEYAQKYSRDHIL